MVRNAPPCAGRCTPITRRRSKRCAALASRSIRPASGPHGTEERRPPTSSPRCRGATTCSIWCASPVSCRRPPASAPRLYVVTRDAQTVVAGDVPNLEQAGLRGLIRVIGTEHPHLRATQIDVDEATDAEQLARQLLSGPTRTRPLGATANGTPPACRPRRCAPRSANHGGRPRARRMRLRDPHAR